MKIEFIALGIGYRSMDDLHLLRQYSLCRMFTIRSFSFLLFLSGFIDHFFTEAQLSTRLFTFIMKKISSSIRLLSVQMILGFMICVLYRNHDQSYQG